MPGDFDQSRVPCLDSMSFYSGLALTVDSGLMIQPEYTQGYSREVLLSIPIETPFSISSNEAFETKSISATPVGDIFYFSKAAPLLHAIQTSSPLQHARIYLELQPKNSLNSKKAMLKPRGHFMVLLGFFKK